MVFTLKTPTFFAGLLAVLAFAAPAHAGNAILEKTGLLGSSRQQIEASLDGLQRARPQRRLPSGATAQLRQPDVAFEGGRFEQTFFFAQQSLAQIELVSAPDASGHLFQNLVGSFREELGAELDAGDSVSWVRGDADVMLYRYGDLSKPTVRLVVRQRQLVEAGEL